MEMSVSIILRFIHVEHQWVGHIRMVKIKARSVYKYKWISYISGIMVMIVVRDLFVLKVSV